jgi:pimeloyl-ACP methyl ester carboxylesterase
MRPIRSRSIGLALSAAVSMSLTLGIALAQDRAPEPDPKGDADAPKDPKAKAPKRKGPIAPVGAPPKKNRPNRPDPLNKNAAGGNVAAAGGADPKAQVPGLALPPAWPFYYKLRIEGANQTSLAAAYYPAKTRFNAPVILLLHDKGPGRSGKDWQEPLDELKGQSLAEWLQEQGYAVLVPDLRGHGANPRKELTSSEWRALPGDVQAMYLFLVDRHNRGELNLAKLGVIAMGDSANLAATWAGMEGAAVSSEGRVGDLSALILISPVADAMGLKLQTALAPIAPRFPIYLLCGDRDNASLPVVKLAQPIVERHQRSKVSYFDTALHGYRLLHFFPKVPGAVGRFLDDPVKGRVLEWEPRYLLSPVAYESEGTVEVKPPPKKDEPAAKKAGN